LAASRSFAQSAPSANSAARGKIPCIVRPILPIIGKRQMTPVMPTLRITAAGTAEKVSLPEIVA
jgi:hypothetical protein